MSRIEGVDAGQADDRTRRVFDAQSERWGAPLAPHLLHARRPAIYKGVRAMWAGIDQSALFEPAFVALINRRVAALVGCVF